MDTIMKKIAYKVNQNNPNLPTGFITEHFETDEDAVEGYLVVSKDVFSQMLVNNISLMRTHESTKLGVSGADPRFPGHMQRPNHEAEQIDASLMAAKKKEMEEKLKKNKENMELFAQFLEWKKSQDGGEGNNGTGTGGGSAGNA
jgi:hypothetical protein